MRVASRPPAFWLFPVGLVIAVGLSLLPGQWPLYAVLAISTAILGLPHGSLDTAVAKRYLPLHSGPRLLGFFAAYLSLGGLVIAFWWQFPNIALGGFLLYSAVHFGDDIAPRIRQPGPVGYGLGIIALPVAFHPDLVAPIFNALGSDQAAVFVAAAPWALGLSAVLFTVGLYQSPQRAMSDWRDPLLLIAAAALLHPLAYFIAYWCFLHSPRHLELAARDLGLNNWQDKLRAVAPTTLASYALVIIALPFLIGLPADAIVLRVIFIGLAALTVPHMLLELIAAPQRD